MTVLATEPGLIAAMGMADCGLTPNLETDISATGIAAWRPVADCGPDHDLLAMDGTGFRFGVRPADNECVPRQRRPRRFCPPSGAARPPGLQHCARAVAARAIFRLLIPAPFG